jgi:DNA primase
MERGDVAPRTFTLRTMAARTAIVGDLWADMSAHLQSIRDIQALQWTGYENRIPQLRTPKV